MKRGWWLGLLFLIAVVPYANTLRNGYVFDDKPLFTENRYVQQGWAGIPELLTRDAFASQYQQFGVEGREKAGRYRPLSLVTFAAEVALVGQKAVVSHALNVVLYGVCVVLLALLLHRLFPDRAWVVAVAAVVFALHPIHAEVVANVKSRDELLSLALMCAACLAAYRSLPGCLLAFVGALLAKEYAVTLVVLIPWLGWVEREPAARIRRTVGLLLGLFSAYLAWRVWRVGWGLPPSGSLVNHPYLEATAVEGWATRGLVLAHYLRMLVWPWPLAYDYSFNQVPYTTFADPRVWLGVGVNCGVMVIAVRGLLSRRPASFVAAWYLGCLGLVSNVVANTGAIMAERSIFHPSVGFALLVGVGVAGLVRRWPEWVKPMVVCGAALGIGCALVIADRNRDWADEETLYLADVEKVPNSALALSNASAKLLDQYYQENDPAGEDRLFRAAKGYAERAVAINAGDEVALLTLGLIRLEEGQLAAAGELWSRAWLLSPGHPSRPLYIGYLVEEYEELAAEAEQGGDAGRAQAAREAAARWAAVAAGAAP